MAFCKRLNIGSFEHGWGQQTDNAGKLKRLEKVKKKLSPRSSITKCSPTNNLILAQ